MQKKTAKKSGSKKEVNFKEFKVTGKTFEYTGRIYQGNKGSGNTKRYWGMSLTLNGVITIKGVKLVETKKDNVFLSWPSYENKGEWYDYIFVDKELNEELDKVVLALMKLVGIDDGDDDEIAEDGDTNLPF